MSFASINRMHNAAPNSRAAARSKNPAGFRMFSPPGSRLFAPREHAVGFSLRAVSRVGAALGRFKTKAFAVLAPNERWRHTKVGRLVSGARAKALRTNRQNFISRAALGMRSLFSASEPSCDSPSILSWLPSLAHRRRRPSLGGRLLACGINLQA